MATKVWQGGAPAVAQVQSYLFAGTWEAGDLVTCTIGDVSFTVTATAVAATTVDAVIAAWNALSATQYPQFAEITAAVGATSATLKLTADTAGVPFTCTLATTEAGGGAADDQTIDGVASSLGVTTIANAGPNDWSTAANWDTGAVPVNTNDVVLENSSVPIYYGLDQSAVTLASFRRHRSFTGAIGLPQWNANGYPEYRPRYLQIGATVCELGQGESGDGPYRENIDFGAVQTACVVNHTRTLREEDAVPSCLLKGTHASNALVVNRGDVGVALYAGETATLLTLKVGYIGNVGGDARVVCGSGVTLTTIAKTGGALTLRSSVTTLRQYEGDTTIYGAPTVTTLTVDGGRVFWAGGGTATTATVGAKGTLDFRRDNQARTVATLKLYAGAKVHDPAQTVVFTNPPELHRCSAAEVTFDVGSNIKLTVASI